MSLEQLAYLAEIIGGIAVVASLIYVGIQIRDSNRVNQTYYHQYVLGLMQEGHWAGYSRYIEGYSVSPGFAEFWEDVGPAFSRDFCNWMTEVVNRKHGLSLPRHEDVGGETPDPLKTR